MQTHDIPFFAHHWVELMQTLNKEFSQTWQNAFDAPPSLKDNVEKTKASFERIFKLSQEKLNSSFKEYYGNPFFKTYQDACDAYLSFLLKVYLAALDLLNEELSPLKTAPNSRYSLSEVSKIWLECCEKTYDQMSKNSEFQQLYGDVINAWGRWKSHTPS